MTDGAKTESLSQPASKRTLRRVLLADDHPVIRRGVREILAEAYPGVQIGEATTAAEAIDQTTRHPWDLVLLDISMPGRSGLDALKDIRRLCPRLPVLVLSVHAEDQYALRVLKAGAAGYVTKDQAPETLLAAIDKVLAGGRYVTPALGEYLAASLTQEDAESPHRTLSDREFEVLRLIGLGRTVSEIALQLSLSVKTVSTYRTRILLKMSMNSNAELTRYAIAHGLA
jgi:two-component system, NarL family, invasion response regulator UvrY